jgi:hypothetical protein
MHWYRNGIRGPTGPDSIKANDRAGNAAVCEIDRGGSGTNQPSRVSRYLCLAPAASVGGKREDVKFSVGDNACVTMYGEPLRRGRAATRRDDTTPSDRRETGMADNPAGARARPLAAFPRRQIHRKWDGLQ